jgi:hypothetical protein
MSVDSVSIESIKTLTDNYNVILEQYIAANKSLSGLGAYEVLSNKKLSDGSPSYTDTLPTIEACQAKCAEFRCTAAAYRTDTKVCNINNTGEVIDGTLSQKVIVNRQMYYLNQLDNLNTQLSDINNQIIAIINTIEPSGTFTSLNDYRAELNAQLDEDKASLREKMSSTAENLAENTNMLDLEYIQRNKELETNSNYYIFLLLLLIFIITLIVLISMQT